MEDPNTYLGHSENDAGLPRVTRVTRKSQKPIFNIDRLLSEVVHLVSILQITWHFGLQLAIVSQVIVQHAVWWIWRKECFQTVIRSHTAMAHKSTLLFVVPSIFMRVLGGVSLCSSARYPRVSPTSAARYCASVRVNTAAPPRHYPRSIHTGPEELVWNACRSIVSNTTS